MQELLVEKNETLKSVRLNRPHRANSLSPNLVELLHEVIEESSKDGTRTFVLRGEGNSFCSGFDLSDLETRTEAEIANRILRVEKMLQALHHAPFTTVSLVQAKAFGAGADMVCSCHIRIAEPNSVFCMPGLNFGILLGTRRLTQRVGIDNALSILTNTRVFDSEEALKMGFLTHVSEKNDWAKHIEAAKKAGAALPHTDVRRMFKVVIPDTRAEDMADLKESVNKEGLIKRIVSYRESLRRRSGKKLN